MKYEGKYEGNKTEIMTLFKNACFQLNYSNIFSNEDTLNFQTPDSWQKGLDVQIYFRENQNVTFVYFNFNWKKQSFGITPIIEVPQRIKSKTFENVTNLVRTYLGQANGIDEDNFQSQKTTKNNNDFSYTTILLIIGIVGIVCFFIFRGGKSNISFTDNCKGNESKIEKGQLRKAESMGMRVNDISVSYLGNCEYRCVMDVYDPGTMYSRPNAYVSKVIFKWDGYSYSFLRNE